MKKTKSWLIWTSICAILVVLTGCGTSSTPRTTWKTPFVMFDCTMFTNRQGAIDVSITNVTGNSMQLNVSQQGSQPSSLSQSPYFYTWDTKPHDVTSFINDASSDPFLDDWSHWFIQNGENDASLTINNNLLQRASDAIGNSGAAIGERLTGLSKAELQTINGGGTVNAGMHSTVINTNKNTLTQFYQSQMLQPGTKYYVYVWRYGDTTSHNTSYVWPVNSSSNTITTLK